MNAESDVASIKGVLEQYAACCRGGDFHTWISLWAEDGIQMPPDAPANTGIEGVRAIMEPMFDQMNLDFEILSIDNAEIHGDLGLTRCTYSLRLVPKDGSDPINAIPEGKALTLYARQADGGWKISYDCFNSNVVPG
jgi:ketosteroid isomerase-like protein